MPITLKVEARGDTRKEAISQAIKILLNVSESPDSISYSTGDRNGSADAKWGEEPAADSARQSVCHACDGTGLVTN